MIKYLALILFFLATLSTSAQQQEAEKINVDGATRKFETYIPSVSNAIDKLPVIISLHGRLGTGKGMMSFADFRSMAQREKIIIVCPDGIDKSWADGRQTPAGKKKIDDVKFIDQLISYILNTYHADAKRIYVTGMSNGGFMASRLACELNNRIAAVAIVGASMAMNMDYKPNKPMPVMYIQGTKDPLVPFDGGSIKSGAGEAYGHADVLSLWATTDHCDKKPVITNLADDAHDGTSVIKEEYSSAKSNIKVIGYTITDGGHTWPGGSQYLPKFLIGSVSHNLNACEVIWDFFKGYRLSE
jgi:polyhydroxybutyrate depolymerase